MSNFTQRRQKHLIILASTLVLVGLPFTSDAQEDNPFSKSDRQDAEIVQRVLRESEADLRKEVTSLREYLSQLETANQGKILALQRENKVLRQKLGTYETKEESNSKSYRILVETMLKSANADIQLFALNSLHEGHVRQLGPELSRSSRARIVELAKGTSEEAKRFALEWLMDNDPKTAAKLGYQRPGLWHSINASPKNVMIKNALAEPAFYDIEETELEEIKNQIQKHYEINFIIAPEIAPQTLITFKSSGASLGTTLRHLLATCELDYYVDGENLAIIKKGNAQPKLTSVYRVTGLLTDDLTVDQIAGLVKDLIQENGKVNTIDHDRITVLGSDSVQQKVSELLGQLAVN